MANTKMFVHYSKTKAEFIAAGLPTTYNNSIVFIKGDSNGNGSCIYTHGTYFANFAEFLAAVNYVKGVNVNGQNYNAVAGGGYLAFSATDPSTVAVNAGQNGITIGLTQDFINTVNNTTALAGNTSTALGAATDAADKDGSAFARIANLAALVSDLTGGETTSIAGQITAAVNALKGTFDATDAATLEAVNDELNAIDAKWADYVTNAALAAIEGSDNAGDKVKVTVASKGGKVTEVTVDESGLTGALNLKANAADVYTKGEVDTTLSEYYTKSETFNKSEVTKAITDEVAKIINDNDDTSINTLEEIAAWIAAHPESVAAINKQISDLSDLVGTDSVATQINNKVATLNATDAAVAGEYVSAVSESNGIISVTRAVLPTYTLAEGATNGTVKFNGTEVKVHGLGSAAYTEASAYATSAQGTKADNALQEITKVDSDYATVTVSAKDANKQSVKVDVKVKAIADATAAKQGFADAYDVNQAVAGAKAYADALFAWEEL